MATARPAFEPYVTDIDFDGLRFKFKIFTKLARDQHHRQAGHPSYRDDIRIGFYGYEQLSFIRDRMIQPGDTIFDVGCEYGFTATVFALWAGKEGRLLGIEAHPWMANLVAQNIKLNSLRTAKVFNAAAGSAEGEILKFHGSGVSVDGKGMSVKTVRLDRFAFLQPDFIKIDIEGYEVEALKGAPRILAQTPKLQIELHVPLLAKYGSSVEEFFGLLPCDRYSFFIQLKGDQSEIVPFDPKAQLKKVEGVVQIFAIPKEARRRDASLYTRVRRAIFWN